MWDFDIGRTLGIMARTWPFILLRMVVYFSITLAYVLATGAGAGVGFGVGYAFEEQGGPGAFAFWGGLVGFGLVSAFVYWVREYILYIVKAGHIAVMVRLIDGQDIPGGQMQITYARDIVTDRFAEANVLFVLDQLIKGVVRVITGLLGGIAAFLPIPGLQGLVRFANTVIRLSLTYVDEIILGYNIRMESTEPFESGRRGIVLYAQNGTTMLKNAVWLAIFLWVLSFAVFLVMIAPAGAVLYMMPGQLGGWAFVLAVVFAWAIKAALLEPFAIAALMQVYFRVIEGQEPNPEWDRRLTEASKDFRKLRDRAAESFRGMTGRAPQAG
ncbi:MAG: hypothetical protein H6893_04240 [Brucellaceae bacterium]|nr:hypothetical protein [Brucellaceae bacterium]